jgi:hypothetical protein
MAMTSSTKAQTKRSSSANDIIREAADTVSGATAEVEARLSDAAAATEAGVRAANDSLRERSDISLALLGAFSVGMGAGLLLGGAHRLLVLASLIPAALVGSIFLERVDRPRPRSSARG